MKPTYVLRIAATFGFVAFLSPALTIAQPSEEDRQRQRSQSAERGERGQRFGGAGRFGARGGRVTRVMLLGIDDVRDELSIDEGQAATIDAAIEAFREERREAFPGREAFQNLSDEQRDLMRGEWQDAQQKLAAKTQEVMAALLETEQNERLGELVVQVNMKANPIGTLTSDELRHALKLSEDQLAQLDAAREAMRDERDDMVRSIREAFSSPDGQRPDFAQLRQNMQNLNERFGRQALEVLTEDQGRQLQTMQGEKLDIDLRSIMRNRRGAGGFRGFGGRRDRRGRDSGNRRPARPSLDDDSV